MRTTVDIPGDLLDEAQRLAETQTRREAILIALGDYVRRRRIQRVIDAAGTLDLDLDARALRATDDRRRIG